MSQPTPRVDRLTRQARRHPPATAMLQHELDDFNVPHRGVPWRAATTATPAPRLLMGLALDESLADTPGTSVCWPKTSMVMSSKGQVLDTIVDIPMVMLEDNLDPYNRIRV